MLVLQNVPLAPLTTLQVGGPARYFIEAKTISEVSSAVELARSQALPLFVLGGGSNLLISDAGWPGLVLKIAIAGIDEEHNDQKTVFEVGAGEVWDSFVAHAVAHNCAGIECLSGIPGSVGGTPVQNVGAYGQEVADTIESVCVFDLKDNQVRELCAEACAFSYRSSLFNTTGRGRYIILRVSFGLIPEGPALVEYADVKRYFAGWSLPPTMAEVREAIKQIRAQKGMLISAGNADSRSAGSFFRNPVLSEEQFQDVTRRALSRHLRIPNFPALEVQHKISAAWLVEHSGFSRGYSVGNVGISRKHALAIINRGSATAAEIVSLKDHIRQRVEEIWGIHLEPEPVFVGF